MSLSGRRRRAVAAAKAAGVDALLVTHLPDVRWLCGFTGSNAALILLSHPKTPGAVLFTDGRYTAQAKAEAGGVQVVIEARAAVAAACAWMGGAGVRRCGFDEGNTSVAALGEMRKAVPAARRRGMFEPVGALVSKLRWVKDAGEIATMRAAAELGCELFEGVLGFMQAGMREVEVAAELEYRARRAGAEGMSFETIVASGARSSLPHGRATSAKLPRQGFCTLDFGVVLDGYCSDMTRTVHFGRAHRGEREVYDAVLEAQEAGVAAVRAGVAGSDVDEAARGVLRRAAVPKILTTPPQTVKLSEMGHPKVETKHPLSEMGHTKRGAAYIPDRRGVKVKGAERFGLAEWFTHSTGHGVGLEIHEGPRLAKKPEGVQKTSPERLKAGMIVTIEPGVYLPGKFGVRIEDTVLVTKAGCEILTPCTKAWIEL